MTVSAVLDPDILDALFLPIERGEVDVPKGARVLFAGARAGAALLRRGDRSWVCEQPFLPFALALERDGWRVMPEAPAEARFDRVLLLPPRQREARRAAFARALTHLADGGVLLACVPNTEGARSAQDDLERLTGPVRTWSKHKCRVMAAGDAVDPDLRQAWAAADTPVMNPAGYVSRPGLFAWERVDAASALLARELPHDLRGAVADLGAGYGYLACQVLERCPAVRRVDLYEADGRALGPAHTNMAQAVGRAGRPVEYTVRWADATAPLPEHYDAIVCNPPFHQGRADLPALGRAFIQRAADALNPGGRLWLVANRHLPYETTLAGSFAQVRTVVAENGFKVFEAVRG